MPIQVNLTPPNSSGNIYVSWVSLKGKYILLGFNIILFLIYLYGIHLERENLAISEDINRLHSDIKSLEDKAITFDDMQNTTKFIETERKKDIDPSFILDFLSRTTPSGIVIKSINAEEDSLKISAISKNSGIFANFIDLMITEGKFSSVQLTASTYNPTENSFSSTFEINYQ